MGLLISPHTQLLAGLAAAAAVNHAIANEIANAADFGTVDMACTLNEIVFGLGSNVEDDPYYQDRRDRAASLAAALFLGDFNWTEIPPPVNALDLESGSIEYYPYAYGSWSLVE